LVLRTLALAIAAFRALAVRCSGVMVSKDRLPPIFPPRAPIARITAEIVFLSMLYSLTRNSILSKQNKA
jgi:hypothetical protein